MPRSHPLSRRQFVGSAGAIGLTLITSRKTDAQPATPRSAAAEKINIAAVGAGGRGGANLKHLVDTGIPVNVVAIADVDLSRASKSVWANPGVRFFTDFRRMLDVAHKDIDAVIVSCPDHNHAVAAMSAMQLGKHVYCEKPLTHSVYEARRLAEAAKKYNVATQMGNHGHSWDTLRMAVDWIKAGVIGNVTEAHIWTDRPGRFWKQGGYTRPTDTPPVPEGLDWDQWIGPAPMRPYHKAYHPHDWRAWWDFGTGALGDMGCHIMDTAFWALDLGAPTSVEAQSEGNTEESGPSWSIIAYDFPARGNLPACKVTWRDGGKLPPRPPELEAARDLAKIHDGGTIFVGDKGTLLVPYSQSTAPRLIPESRMKDFKKPDRVLPRSPGHHREWLEAARGGTPAMSNFGYSGPLTEMVLLGNVAIRAAKKVEWDAANLKIANAPELQHLIRREYRKGWTL